MKPVPFFYNRNEFTNRQLRLGNYLLEKNDFKLLSLLFLELQFVGIDYKDNIKLPIIKDEYFYLWKLFSSNVELILRQNYKPIDGYINEFGFWTPEFYEKKECCNRIASFNTLYPNVVLAHCQTAKHLANLYTVSCSDLRKLNFAVRKERKYQTIQTEVCKTFTNEILHSRRR